jgi:hypothetical protein
MGQTHPGPGHQPQVHQREFGTQLLPPPQAEHDDRGEEQPQDPRTAPPPLTALRHPEQQTHQSYGESQRAEHVEAARLPDGRLAHRPPDPPHTDRAERAGRPEHDVPVGVLHDQRRERQSERGADTDRGAHERHRAAPALRRQFVPQDADRQGYDGGGGALQGAGEDQDADVGGQGAHDRADGHQAQGAGQDPPLAVHVAGPAEHGGEDGAGEQGRGDHPGDGARGGVGQPGQGRQQRDDHGLHDRHEDPAERQHRNGEPVPQGAPPGEAAGRVGYRDGLAHGHSSWHEKRR